MAYTTYGSVRGCCGHKHRSVETAQRCLDKDQQNCIMQGGYSDRQIVEIRDGFLWEVDGDDNQYIRSATGRGIRFHD